MSEEYPFAQEKHLIHIRGLEATLTDRNRTIEQLQEQLSEERIEAFNEAQANKAYLQGWKDCAKKLMGATHKAAISLREVREEAFQAVLEGELR